MQQELKLALVAATFAAVGTIAGAAISNWSAIQLAKQKHHSDLVMKALEPTSGPERLQSLKLLVDTKLIKDEEVREGVQAYFEAKEKDPSSIPRVLPFGGLAPTSRAPAALLGRGKHIVAVPPDVESMWVFYQSKEQQDPKGCRRAPNADSIPPQAFMARLDEFIDFAQKNRQYSLVVTAASPRGWDAAASEIQINGRALSPGTAYWCNGKKDLGYEVVVAQ